MEEKYKLRYLPLFYDDLTEIVDYVSMKLNNPDAALKLINDVERSILQRKKCPEAFEPYKSHKRRAQPYYRIYVGNYIIYYVVLGDVMEVRRILYGKRNVDSYL